MDAQQGKIIRWRCPVHGDQGTASFALIFSEPPPQMVGSTRRYCATCFMKMLDQFCLPVVADGDVKADDAP